MKSKEVTAILKCSASSLKNYRDAGHIEYKKIGGTYFYNLDRSLTKPKYYGIRDTNK